LTLVLEEHFPEIEHQEKASLLAVINHKDVFAILPNRHGKSIRIQLLPDVCRNLYLSDYSYSYNAIILVLCLLKSLADSRIGEM